MYKIRICLACLVVSVCTGMLALGAENVGSGPGPRRITVPYPMAIEKPPGQAVNAKDFGAVGDGKADDTGALQAALDAAIARGPICYLPAGLYRLDGSLVVPPG